MDTHSNLIALDDEQELCWAVQMGDVERACKLARIVFVKEFLAHDGHLEILRSEITAVVGVLTRKAIEAQVDLAQCVAVCNKCLYELLDAKQPEDLALGLIEFARTISSFNTAERNARRLVLRSIQEIERDPANAPSIMMLAERLHLSRFHFGRLFKEYSGMTYTQFVTQAR